MRCILEGWRAGGSYLGIAAQLNAEGVPAKQGGRWHPSTVARVVAHGGKTTRRFSGHSERSVATPARACPPHTVGLPRITAGQNLPPRSPRTYRQASADR